jgi:hypothetical protein
MAKLAIPKGTPHLINGIKEKLPRKFLDLKIVLRDPGFLRSKLS